MPRETEWSEHQGPIRHTPAPRRDRGPRMTRDELIQERMAHDIERAERSIALQDHLLESEVIHIATRKHPIVLLTPILACLGSFAIMLYAASTTTAPMGGFLLLWALTVLWLASRWLQWWRHRFIATDKRILKMYGVLTTTVDSMRNQKVTDMSYHRDFWGEIIGYGGITIESAGQDQALHDIDYLPYPRENYQALCHLIFGEGPRSARSKRRGLGAGLQRLMGRSDRMTRDEEYEIDYPDHSELEQRHAATEREHHDAAPRMLYSSQDDRSAPTSPIPIYPPGYFRGRDDGGSDEDYHDDPTRT